MGTEPGNDHSDSEARERKLADILPHRSLSGPSIMKPEGQVENGCYVLLYSDDVP